MINVKVCVGSSCHLKGSYDVIQTLKAIIKKYDVEDLIELQASFCLGVCFKGVTMKIDGFDGDSIKNIDENIVEKIKDNSLYLYNVNSENAEEIFVQNIYPLLGL